MVLVVDVGTSVTKAGLIDENGDLISSFEVENEFSSPEKGAVEHDPNGIFASVLKVISKAVEGYEDVVDTLVLSSYQLGLIVLDSNLKPLTGLITLLDTRSKRTFEEALKLVDPEKLYERTGCPPSHLYPFFKMLWLRMEKEDIFKRARYFLDSKSYLIFRLTGDILTEPSMASATQVFNISQKRWDDYALSVLKLDPENFPKVVDGDEIAGEVSKSIVKEIGLKRLDLVPGVYDGGGIVIGLGGLEKDIGVVNLGTTSMLRSAVEKPVLDGEMRLQTYSFFKDVWLTGEGINNAGIALRWLKNITGKAYDDLNDLAEGIKPGSDGLIFLPYLTGERDPRLRGMFGNLIGLREFHTVGHLTRSLFEGVAFTLRMVKDALEENSIDVREIRIGGSGTRSKIWLEIIANVLNVPVRRSSIDHVSFVGEAMLGYVAKGVYRSLEDAVEMIKVEPPILPDGEVSALYDEIYESFKETVRLLSRR